MGINNALNMANIALQTANSANSGEAPPVQQPIAPVTSMVSNDAELKQIQKLLAKVQQDLNGKAS